MGRAPQIGSPRSGSHRHNWRDAQGRRAFPNCGAQPDAASVWRSKLIVAEGALAASYGRTRGAGHSKPAAYSPRGGDSCHPPPGDRSLATERGMILASAIQHSGYCSRSTASRRLDRPRIALRAKDDLRPQGPGRPEGPHGDQADCETRR
jgi:hypothetical protein